MMKKFTLAVLTTVLFAVPAFGQESTREEFQEYCRMMEGRWIGDVIWSWSNGDGHRHRPLWVHLALHGFMLFMVINGAVVFVASPMRWLGLAVSVVAFAALIASVRRVPASS